MHATPTTRALLLFALCAATAGAQTTPAPATAAARPKPRLKAPRSEGPAYNTSLIVLDPAHGGADNGATLGPNSYEKDATVALAGRLRAALTAQGFTVVLTHEAATDETTPEARIELANRNRPVACILLHASNGGHGVHLYTSALALPSANPYAANSGADDAKAIVPWGTAQARVLPQSQRLAADLAAALNGIRIPLVVGQSSVRPIDSMTCPAVALELAPLNPNGDSSTPASDAGYQQRVADSVATALGFWRGHVISATVAAQAAQAIATPSQPETPKPAPKPKPKPVVVPKNIPDETPAELSPGNAPATPPPAKPKPAPAPAPKTTTPAATPPSGGAAR